MDKYGVVTFVQRRIANPVVRAGLDRGLRLPGYALLETTGGKTGRLRRIPVGDGLVGDALVGDTFWIVAEHGKRSAYVRNIEANPRVRVRTRGRWRAGTAEVMHSDDPRQRQRQLGEQSLAARLNAVVVRACGTDLLTVRIDLDPVGGEGTSQG